MNNKYVFKNTGKDLLKGSTIIICSFIFILIFFTYKENIIFSIFTWENCQDPKSTSYIGIFGNDRIEENVYFDKSGRFYIYNFKNCKMDFLKVDSIMNFKSTNSKQLYFTHDDNIFHGSFLWNTSNNINKYITYPQADSPNYLQLFSVKAKKNKNEYFYVDIILSANLSNSIQFKFDKHTNGRVIETSCKDFNFNFWSQAEDYLQTNKLSLTKNKYMFKNKNMKIAEFDFSSGVGYQLNIND